MTSWAVASRTLVRIGLSGAALLVGAMATADVVTDWNEQMLLALRAENAGPTGGSRTAAIVHAAIYDAVNSVLRTHEPYRLDVPPGIPGALPEAAALAAAYHTLTVLCPSKTATFAGAYAETLESLPSGSERDEGLRIGAEIAALILDERGADRSTTQVTYIPDNSPGAWRRTPPDFRPPLDPHWGFVRPFVIPATVHFPVPPPPPLADVEYAEAYELTRQFGARTTAHRTEEETRIGLFWAYDRAQLGPATILYNRILQVVAAQKGNTLAENARLFALVNLAQADAGIVCWKAKYDYNLWRPITAIRAGDTDGNAETQSDAAWEPLGCPGADVQADFTPPFPSYPSGHAMFGSALFQVLRRFYGRDDIAFSAASEELPGHMRHFANFSEAEEENTLARVYLGVHWIYDQRVGQSTAWQIADYVFATALRPLPPVPHLSIPLKLPDGHLAIHLSAAPGHFWRIRKSDNPAGAWMEHDAGQGPITLIEWPDASAGRFYRVIHEP